MNLRQPDLRLQHERIQLSLPKLLPVLVKGIKILKLCGKDCSHGGPHNLWIKGIHRRTHDRHLIEFKTKCAPHDGSHVACIGRIDKYNMGCVLLQTARKLAKLSDHITILLLRQYMKYFVRLPDRYTCLTTDLSQPIVRVSLFHCRMYIYFVDIFCLITKKLERQRDPQGIRNGIILAISFKSCHIYPLFCVIFIGINLDSRQALCCRLSFI